MSSGIRNHRHVTAAGARQAVMVTVSLLLVVALLVTDGCATGGGVSRGVEKEAPGQETPSPAGDASGGDDVNAGATPSEQASDPCRVAKEGEDKFIDQAQRRLARTLCSATLWFDGLFGEQENVGAARNAAGRLELSILHSDYEGTKLGSRFNARVRLPNLEEHFEAFVAREDQRDYVADRIEGLALRSQFLDVDTRESWIAGVGYSPFENERWRPSFRLGARVSSATEVFAQARVRRDLVVSEWTSWHLRQTVFWTNRDGFGTTSSVALDRALSSRMLLRLHTVGTVSEVTDGVDWRSALVLFRNLKGLQAVAGQLFVRGGTAAEVRIWEYGVRAIYRRPLMGRDWFVGEWVLGYSWPRIRLEEDRKGSASAGFGIDLVFGRRQ